MTHNCMSIGCSVLIPIGTDFCADCFVLNSSEPKQKDFNFEDDEDDAKTVTLQRTPQYKSIKGEKDIDVFAIHQLFEINDSSGCIQQASTKLLLSSDNLTCKPLVQDICDARDILNRWLELNDSVH